MNKDACNCMCHDDSGIPEMNAKHIIACCDWCTSCNRYIKLPVYDEHIKSCRKQNSDEI